MSAVAFDNPLDRAVEHFERNCPKCGGEMDSEDSCVDCMYAEETSLTPDEAREFTWAGD